MQYSLSLQEILTLLTFREILKKSLIWGKILPSASKNLMVPPWGMAFFAIFCAGLTVESCILQQSLQKSWSNLDNGTCRGEHHCRHYGGFKM